MNWEAMFPGKYIKSAEFNGKPVTLTITGVKLEDLPEDKGGTKRRGVVSFKETPKALVINRTNATCIKQMFGGETDGWKGKRVTLYAAPFTDPFTGEVGTAVRVLGSPDIQGPLQFSARIGRKQAQFKLQKTSVGGKKATAPQEPPPVTEPPPFTEEPPDDLPLPGSPDYDASTGEVTG